MGDLAFRELETSDWEDLNSVSRSSRPVFDRLSDPDVLNQLLDDVVRNPHLSAMCERYDFLDKLVLYDDRESSFRIRLHLFRGGYFDRPHNHRWSFASHILSGQYLHRLFGDESLLLSDDAPAVLRPIMERVELPGDQYVLHHNSVHSVQADEDTISLVLRGPSAKDRFLIRDDIAKEAFWVKGAASETKAEREAKRMSSDVLEAAVMRVRKVLDLA